MRAYERLVADDEVASPTNNAFNTVVDAQESAKRRRNLRGKLERLVWILASVMIVSIGDGSTDLVTIMFRRYKEARFWFLTSMLSLTANFCILGYLVIFLKLHRRGSKWAESATWALPTSSCLGAVSFVGFGIVLWPVYGWATPVVEVVLCLGFLMATHFLPSATMHVHKE